MPSPNPESNSISGKGCADRVTKQVLDQMMTRGIRIWLFAIAFSGAIAVAFARPPAMAQGSDILLATQIERELLTRYDILPSQVDLSDSAYVPPSHDWIVSSFLPHVRNYWKSLDLEALGEGMDCDNFAQLFRQQLVLSNALGGGARYGDVPCAAMKTRQNEPFGGVAGDGQYHSLILLRSDLGWHAIEPQTGELVALESYPNRNSIAVALF